MAWDPRVAVVIPVYGQLDRLQACLDSLGTARRAVPFDLVIVDDGTPGGLGALRDRYPAARILVRDRQGGFTAAVNTALREIHADYDAYVLLNSDTRVLDDWLDSLIERWADFDELGVVGGMELASDEPDRIVCGGNLPVLTDGQLTDLLTIDRQGRVSAGDWQAAERVEWTSFGVSLITRRCLETVGFLDERFQNYFSDADFGVRANRQRFEVWYEPKCRVLHDRHATTGLDEPDSLMALQGDRERYCAKWIPPELLGPTRVLRWIRWCRSTETWWMPRLLPHLDPSAPIDGDVRNLFLAQDGVQHDVDIVLSQDPGRPLERDTLMAFRQLYSRGLAYVERLDASRYRRSEDPFLAGVPVRIIAPHPDDAALSMGGLLLDRAETGNDTCIHVLFGGSSHARGGLAQLGPRQITALRRFEEVTYCGKVGAGSQIGGLPDRLLRRPADPILLAHPGEAELELLPAILRQFDLALSQRDVVLMVPLAAGLMADHVLAAIAAAAVVRAGFPPGQLLVYEDLPYAAEPGAIRAGLNLYSRLGLELRPLVMEVTRWLQQKCELLSIYASQVDEPMALAVEAHGRTAESPETLSPVGLADNVRSMERLWQPVAA